MWNSFTFFLQKKKLYFFFFHRRRWPWDPTQIRMVLFWFFLLLIFKFWYSRKWLLSGFGIYLSFANILFLLLIFAHDLRNITSNIDFASSALFQLITFFKIMVREFSFFCCFIISFSGLHMKCAYNNEIKIKPNICNKKKSLEHKKRYSIDAKKL